MGHCLGFITLGVGDAFSSRYYASCIAVGFESSWVLVDCPHPIRKMLHEASSSAGIDLDLNAIDGVILTHLHADHCSGVEGFLYFNHFALNRRPFIATHPEVGARLWPAHLAGGMDSVMLRDGSIESKSLSDFARLVELSDDGEVNVGPFRVACRKTHHAVPTTALRIRAGGRCLGYSADTSFDPSLIDWLSESDLFIHETNLGIHTDYQSLVALPIHIRRKMLLIHYPDAFDVTGTEIEALRQGRWYEV